MLKRLFSGKILDYFPSLILIVTALVLAPDTFRNPQKIYEVIGIASGSLILPFLLLQLIARYWADSGLKPLVKLPLIIALIILWPLIIGLSIYSRDAHPNAVYHPSQKTMGLLRPGMNGSPEGARSATGGKVSGILEE